MEWVFSSVLLAGEDSRVAGGGMSLFRTDALVAIPVGLGIAPSGVPLASFATSSVFLFFSRRSALLHARKWECQRFMITKKKRTHEPCKNFNASETSGRKRASWSQHCCINVHNLFVEAGCAGRRGGLPLAIAIVVAAHRLLPNGTVSVNTYVEV